MKVTRKWIRMSKIYQQFCPVEDCYDFGPTSEQEMFLHESTGKPKLSLVDRKFGKYNGFVVGKHWMDVTVKMWKEDIDNGLLNRDELEKDFPLWFLQKVGI